MSHKKQQSTVLEIASGLHIYKLTAHIMYSMLRHKYYLVISLYCDLRRNALFLWGHLCDYVIFGKNRRSVALQWYFPYEVSEYSLVRRALNLSAVAIGSSRGPSILLRLVTTFLCCSSSIYQAITQTIKIIINDDGLSVSCQLKFDRANNLGNVNERY